MNPSPSVLYSPCALGARPVRGKGRVPPSLNSPYRIAPSFRLWLRTPGTHASTPLDRSAIRGYLDLVNLLAERGASLSVVNEFGGAPLPACVWGSTNFRDPDGDYPACVERLIEAGAPVPAAAGGSEAVQEVLRRHGAA